MQKYFYRCLAVWFLSASLCQAETAADNFYATPPDSSSNLPIAGVYPQGRKLAFLGYSGNPARDLRNGFTVAGPVYQNQTAYLRECFAHGWPVVAQIGPHITFADGSPAKYHLDEPLLRRQIQQQLQPLASHQEIVWWAVTPEELRPAEPDEMKYLAIVCATIRQNDPLHRPIYLYNPNHRTADTLLPIARQVDVLGKGSYVNHTGHKRDRVWVRWSVEQEINALDRAGRSNAIPLVMPELCQDPEPSEDREIRSWVRHDVYLGLATGAKGVCIWSLYDRPEVARTWQIWYDAYVGCAKELNGQKGLAQVFLFGERRSDLKVNLLHGAAMAEFSLGGKAEPKTTSVREAANRKVALPAWTSAEFACGNSRWLFLINSGNTPATLTVNGWPKGSSAQNVFDDASIPLEDAAPLQLELPAYGVTAIRFSKQNPNAK